MKDDRLSRLPVPVVVHAGRSGARSAKPSSRDGRTRARTNRRAALLTALAGIVLIALLPPIYEIAFSAASGGGGGAAFDGAESRRPRREKPRVNVVRRKSFTHQSAEISDAPYAVCISGHRLTSLATLEALRSSLDRFVLGLDDGRSAAAATAGGQPGPPPAPPQKVDVYIHAFYDGDPALVPRLLGRYRDHLKGFVIQLYGGEFLDDLRTDAAAAADSFEQQQQQQRPEDDDDGAGGPMSLWRGVGSCHSLVRHQEMIRMRRYETVMRTSPEARYRAPVVMSRYSAGGAGAGKAALYFPVPPDCCATDEPIVNQDDKGILTWNSGAVGFDDRMALGPSYAMELYSGMYRAYVSETKRNGRNATSAQALHRYLVDDLRIPTFKAEFTYELLPDRG